MTFFWVALAALACGGVGWRNGLHRTRVASAVVIILLLAAVVGILTLRGTAQQVVAGAMIGLVLGDLGASFLMWRRRAAATATPAD